MESQSGTGPFPEKHCPARRAGLRGLAAGMVLAALLGVPVARSQPAAEPLSLGIAPYFSPSRLEEVYAPAASELSQSLRRSVAFRTASSWDRFFAQLKAQQYDIALVHAFFYVPAADEFGYVPLARMREPFTAVVVVPQDSPIRNAEELRGKVIATPPPYLPAVHLGKKALRDRGLVRGRTVTFEETRTVDACLQQALIGATQACIAPPFAVGAFQASYGVRLRILLESEPLPSPVFIVHRRVPEPERERIRAALLEWNRTAAGQAVLKSINTQALVPARDEDYQPVRIFVRGLDEPWRPSVP